MSDEVYIIDTSTLEYTDDDETIIDSAVRLGYRLDNNAAHQMYGVG